MGCSAAEYLTLKELCHRTRTKGINHLPLTSERLQDRGYLIRIFPPPLQFPGPEKTFDKYMWKEGRKKGYPLRRAMQVLPLPMPGSPFWRLFSECSLVSLLALQIELHLTLLSPPTFGIPDLHHHSSPQRHLVNRIKHRYLREKTRACPLG